MTIVISYLAQSLRSDGRYFGSGVSGRADEDCGPFSCWRGMRRRADQAIAG